MRKGEIDFKGRKYPIVEIFHFETADGCLVPNGVFCSEDFEALDDESADYNDLDYFFYGYLPPELFKKPEREIRKFIKENIG